MRFGLFQTVQWPAGSDQRQQYRNALAQAVLAEELGYHSVWMTEHHFTRHAITSDSLLLLSHLASRTERIRLGTAVAVLPFHDPVRFAESTALVDQLSDGRLDVGVGRGYQWSEYHGFGIGLDEGNDRFEEALALLLQSWTADAPFAFEGKYHSYDAAFPQPRSIQRPHPPLWHATASADGLRRCAQNGWGVLLAQGTPPEAIRQTVALYQEQLDSLSMPRSSERLVLARGMYCAPTTAEAVATYLGPYHEFSRLAAKVSAPPPDEIGAPHRNPFQFNGEAGLRQSLVCGDPDECSRALQELQEFGIDYVILFVNLGGMEHDRVVASMRLFAEEVMPRFAP